MPAPDGASQDDNGLDDVQEDDGELDPSETLLSDPGERDPEQGPVDAPDGYRGATAFGTTGQEERSGQSLDALLRQEEPELSDTDPAGDEQDGTPDGQDPSGADDPGQGGVLTAVEDGSPLSFDDGEVAQRAGSEGDRAAEDAAVHVLTPP